jgi:hypothetical protein
MRHCPASGANLSRSCSTAAVVTRRGEVDPHEEVPRGPVAELLEVNDVALLLEQEVRDRLDDSQGIRAMEGQHKLPAGRAGLIRRGLALRRRLVRRRLSK